MPANRIRDAFARLRRTDVVTHWRWLLLGAVLLATIARLLSYSVVVTEDYIVRSPHSDYGQYADIARNLVAGNGFVLYNQPNIRRAPGFPVFVAGIYAVFGESTRAVIVANSLLTIGIVLLTGMLGRRIAGERVGLVAACLVAINPVQVKYGLAPLSEPLFTLLVVAGIVVLTPFANQFNWKRAAVGGVLIGLACLVRSSILILPAFLGAWWLWRLRWSGIVMTAVFTMAMLSVIAPWTARNWVVTGTLVPVNKMDGITFITSNNRYVLEDREYLGAVYMQVPTAKGMHNWRQSPREQVEIDEIDKRTALTFIYDNLDRMPYLVTMKFARFFSLLTRIPIHLKIILYSLDVVFVPISIIGVVILFQNRRWAIGPSLAFVVATMVAVAIFWGDSRFRFPIVPYYTIFASVALSKAFVLLKAHGSRSVRNELAEGKV